MMGWFAALQAVLVGGILLWAGAFKLLSRSTPQVARRSALRRIVGTERAPHAFRLVGFIEIAIATALLVPRAHPAGSVVATAWCVALVGYLGYARVAAPESSCGCLSERHTPVGWRNFGRAALLVVGSALSLFATVSWPAAIGGRPVAAILVLVLEAAVLVTLSPDLDGRWLIPLRRLRLRISHPLAGKGFEVPLDSTVQQLLRSEAYRSVAGDLHSDLLDTWDEGEWRILTYAARQGEKRSTAVFAVPKSRYQPEDIRVVLVDEHEQAAMV